MNGPGQDRRQPVRVAFVTNFVPAYRVSFYRKLAQLEDVSLTLIHGEGSGDTARPAAAAEATDGLPAARVRNRSWRVWRYTLRWQAGAAAAVRRSRPDVVVVSGIAGSLSNWLIALWTRVTGRGLILWVCGWESQARGSAAHRLKRLLLGIYYRLPHRVLTYSTAGARYMRELGVRRARVQVCYNGIDIEPYLAREEAIQREAAERRRRDAPGVDVLFLYVGGMTREKRVGLLLEAFAAFRTSAPRKAGLWLVGAGPEEEALRREAARLGLDEARFFGRVDETSGVEALFAAADVFLLPGVGGLALNQAMFFRVPCICSVADGTEDDLVTDGETGFRFRPGDSADLARAMERAGNAVQDGTREAMGSRARDRIVERSRVRVMVETFRAAILACAQRGAR